MKKLFLDSDIMLDAGLRRNPFYISAINLLELCHQSQIQCVASSNAFINTYYFMRKFAPATAMASLKNLRSILSITEVNERIVDLALNSNFSDFEDAVQYYAALSANADAIITRNIKDYKRSTIPVLTAEQFLRTL